jgi:NAD(P)-dependent dehydrogenase (short-subunit alcohol dehydrogenase family)
MMHLALPLQVHWRWYCYWQNLYQRLIPQSKTLASYIGFVKHFNNNCFLYSSAKLGLVGLTKTCAAEGEKSGVFCNVIVPMAASRLTEDIFPPGF